MSTQLRLALLSGVICFLSLQPYGELGAFGIVLPGVHQKITRDTLHESNFHFTLPNGAQVTFGNSAIDPIELNNQFIDDWSKDTPFYRGWHFDDEHFSIGQGHLLDTRDLIILQLKDEAFKKSDTESLYRQVSLTKRSRELLGNALHPLQDYYSHTNWVERHLKRGYTTENIPINSALGAKGEPLPAGTNETCDENDPGNIQLTSGQYNASDIFDCTFICIHSPKECAHGNVLPESALQALSVEHPECGAINPNCGINKDRSFRKNHEEAYEVAKKHTAVFVKKIFEEALQGAGNNKNSVALAICQFMGVPDPLATCVTSHTITVQKLTKANGQPTLEGLVQSSGGNISPAIDCGLLCEGTAIAGSTVVLTAQGDANWKFVRWAVGGACAGSTSPECSFSVSGNMLAKPEFTPRYIVIPLSPQASFIRSDPADSTLNPVVIDLSELGVEPGEEMVVSSFGFFSWGLGLPDEGRNTIMVFSSSNQLLPHNEQNRVPGALFASVNAVVTTNTCLTPELPTDIPEDFLANDPVVVSVPAGALFLFAGTWDCFYGDNSDSNGDLGIAIRLISD
jgi:hypothetical protein